MTKHVGWAENKGIAPLNDQKSVSEYFSDAVSHWDNVYRQRGLTGLIYQRRQEEALMMLNRLELPVSARILEVGCGAGYLTVSLARRGYTIDAMDPIPAMLSSVCQRAEEAGVGSRVRVHLGDAHHLAFDARQFDAVIALGVIPWLHSPAQALGEMRRVLKSEGFILVTVDNRLRLNHLLDPRWNPWIAPMRDRIRDLLEQRGLRAVRVRSDLPTMHTLWEMQKILASLKMEIVRFSSVGFGPFTMLGKRVVPERFGKLLHRFLQFAADRRIPLLRHAGNHCVILARRAVPRN